MNLDEAIRITDPATCQEALYKYDPEERAVVENEARHIVAQALCQKQTGDWISVDDRLPEESGEYLTLCKTPNGDFEVKLSTLFPYEGNWYWNDYAIERVTHWQPLPDQPKEN